MQALDDEALGWFHRRLPWGSYGMLARASISAPTLGVALQRWCRHHGLLPDDITLRLDSEGGTATLSLTEHRDLGRSASSARSRCCATRTAWPAGSSTRAFRCRARSFRLPAPAHPDAYAVLFPGPTRFETGPAAIRFDARYLQLPLQRDEAALRQMLQRALPLTVLQYRRDRLLVQRVRQPWPPTPPPRTAPRPWRSACTCHRARCTVSSRRKAPRCRA